MEEYLIPRWLYINFVRLLTKDFTGTTCKIYTKHVKNSYKIFVECSNGVLMAGTASNGELKIVTKKVNLEGYSKRIKYNKEYRNALEYLHW